MHDISSSPTHAPTQLLIIQEYISLRDKNWFGTGGPARFYCEPQSISQFQEALTYAHMHKLSLFMLGQGANILINDAGFDGLIIRPRITSTVISAHTKDAVLLTVGAGAILSDVITFCLDNNILGLEEFSGIPGTIGGSLYINIHYYEFLLSQFLHEAVIIHKETGSIQTVSPSWFAFGYNQSQLQLHDYFVINATFKLKPCNDIEAAYARGRHKEIIRHRINRYPAKGTCGSFFRNFHDHEVTLTIQNKKMIYVAYYLDKIGIKGALHHGGASVSYQHANMLVNSGTATTHDIITVARAMQKKVYDTFNVMPHPECLLVGFDTYPLLD